MSELSRCRSCQAPIVWRKTPGGKYQPMDFDLLTGKPTDVSHFATCPQADAWRKREPSERAG